MPDDEVPQLRDETALHRLRAETLEEALAGLDPQADYRATLPPNLPSPTDYPEGTAGDALFARDIAATRVTWLRERYTELAERAVRRESWRQQDAEFRRRLHAATEDTRHDPAGLDELQRAAFERRQRAKAEEIEERRTP